MFFYCGMIFPEGGAAVNAKSVGRLLQRRFGTELGGQAIGRRLHDFCPALKGLDGEAPDRTGDAECADDLAGEVLHRDCDASNFEIELAIVESDAAAPDVLDLAQQHGNLRDRLLGRWLQFDALEKTLELIRTQRGEDDLAKRRAVGRPD